MNWKLGRNLIKIYGHAVSVALSIVMYVTFLVAYYLPEKAAVIYIDSYGEAHVEMLLFLICMPLVFLSCLYMLQDLKKG